MNMSRREFLQMLAVASAAGINLAGCDSSSQSGEGPKTKGASAVKANKASSNMYEIPAFGNVSLLHYTDCHAQLLPIYFREPNINLGVGSMKGNPPHLVGDAFLKKFGITDPRLKHAFTFLDFASAAKKFGAVGGFAHLATLVKEIRSKRPGSLLLDGGDTWGGGSGTAVWTAAQDMVDAQKLLGVDVMTAHWEFTYGHKRVKEVIENDFKGKIDFVAQNVVDKEFEERVFKPYVIKEINKVPVAIIGQSFPYTPIANPKYFVPGWSFGIRDEAMQEMVDEVRKKGAKVVIVLSHNGMDVDLKMATRVTGIDAIMGGHTHDAVPKPVEVSNAGGKTLVINSGSNAKFLSVLDLDVKGGKVAGYKFHMLPVFSNLITPDPAMSEYITKMRAQKVTFQGQSFVMKDKLEEKLAVTDQLLYRRGNFNGTFDQLICDALLKEKDAEISFSPGFRWGVSVLPGQDITFEHVMTQTGLTYPITTRNELSGTMIKTILEDVADNLFHSDPYYQQGGDMVRVGGLKYEIDPNAKAGNRITYMELKGQPLDANKKYVVAGWASIQKLDKGVPIWDLVAKYLRDQKVIKKIDTNEPKIIGKENNPGYQKDA